MLGKQLSSAIALARIVRGKPKCFKVSARVAIFCNNPGGEEVK